MDPQESINNNEVDASIQNVLSEIKNTKDRKQRGQTGGGQQAMSNAQSDLGFVTNFLEQANARGMTLEETLNKVEQVVKMEDIFTGGGSGGRGRQEQRGQGQQRQQGDKNLEDMDQVTENDIDDLMK